MAQKIASEAAPRQQFPGSVEAGLIREMRHARDEVFVHAYRAAMKLGQEAGFPIPDGTGMRAAQGAC